MEEPGGLQSMGSQSRTQLSDFTFFFLSGLHLGGTAPLTPTSPSQPLSVLCPSHSCSLPQPVQERLKPGSWRTVQPGVVAL